MSFFLFAFGIALAAGAIGWYLGEPRGWRPGRGDPRARREYPPLNPHVPMPADPPAPPGRGDPIAVVELYACPCVVHRDADGPRLTPCCKEHDESLRERMERLAQ